MGQALSGLTTQGAHSGLALADRYGHEEVLIVQDRKAGLSGVIAIHDTTLGPATGGTRCLLYPGLDAAVSDALRLSRAMTLKAALCGVSRGGGKAVLIANPTDKSRTLFQAYAKVLDRLDGRFHTGPDMGFEARDVAVLGRLTKHVSRPVPGSSYDIAETTATGVVASIDAAARALGKPLGELHVVLQGLGQLGSKIARQLAQVGTQLTVADVDSGRVERVVAECEATAVAPEAVYDVACDVFSTNAGGSVLDDATIPRLRCKAVVGGANEQLAEPCHGDALAARGILYAPDFVVNAGGLLTILLETGETDEEGLAARAEAIGSRVSSVWERAAAEKLAPHRVAEQMAEEKLAAVRSGRVWR